MQTMNSATSKSFAGTRHLIARMHGDPIDEACYVLMMVNEELRREIAELRELAHNAKARMGGAVDITLRGKVEAVVLQHIDPEDPPVCWPPGWWQEFVRIGAPVWIPDDDALEAVGELADVFRAECHGVQVWCDYTNAVRFTCYPKSEDYRLESSDLGPLLDAEVTL